VVDIFRGINLDLTLECIAKTIGWYRRLYVCTPSRHPGGEHLHQLQPTEWAV